MNIRWKVLSDIELRPVMSFISYWFVVAHVGYIGYVGHHDSACHIRHIYYDGKHGIGFKHTW